MTHECAPGNDPRHRQTCVKCGRLIPASETPVDLTNHAFELEATRVAALAAGADAETLIAFSDARRRAGAVDNHLTRDFFQEVVEEFADARNYLVWWLEQMDANGVDDPQARHSVMLALGACAVAFHHARMAHAHQR